MGNMLMNRWPVLTGDGPQHDLGVVKYMQMCKLQVLVGFLFLSISGCAYPILTVSYSCPVGATPDTTRVGVVLDSLRKDEVISISYGPNESVLRRVAGPVVALDRKAEWIAVQEKSQQGWGYVVGSTPTIVEFRSIREIKHRKRINGQVFSAIVGKGLFITPMESELPAANGTTVIGGAYRYTPYQEIGMELISILAMGADRFSDGEILGNSIGVNIQFLSRIPQSYFFVGFHRLWYRSHYEDNRSSYYLGAGMGTSIGVLNRLYLCPELTLENPLSLRIKIEYRR